MSNRAEGKSMTKATSQGAEDGSLSFLQELQRLEGELFRKSFAK